MRVAEEQHDEALAPFPVEIHHAAVGALRPDNGRFLRWIDHAAMQRRLGPATGGHQDCEKTTQSTHPPM